MAQDALLRLYRIANSGSVQDPGSFQKFVWSVAKNVCVDVWHRERRRARHETPEDPEREPVDPSGGVDDGIQRRERRDVVTYILQRLSDSCRQLWQWVYAEGRSAAEVAERLAITPGNVRVRVHRCLETARRLRREYESWPGGGREAR